MPGGRPPLPGTLEEKASARRERVRLNVRAHRARKKQQATSPTSPTGYQSSKVDIPVILSKEKLPTSRSRSKLHLWTPPLTPPQDIAKFSTKSQIELSFGTLLSVVHDFESKTGRFPWVKALQQYRTADRLVDISLAAAGAAFLGHVNKDQRLITFAQSSYYGALQKMQMRVKDAKGPQAMMLSMVTNGLMVFETSSGAERTAESPWGTHAFASSIFLELAGPESYRSEMGRQFLRCQRPTALQTAVYDRKPCFLDTEEWRSIPFEGGHRTIEDDLWDVVVTLPRCLSSADLLAKHLREQNKAVLETCSLLKADVVKTRGGLKQWLSRLYRDSSTRPTKFPGPASWLQDGLPEVFTSCLGFVDHFHAELHTIYWTSLLFVHLLIGATQHGLRSAGLPRLAEMFNIVEHDETEQLANNICQALEWCLGPDEKDLRGTIYAGYLPLQTAIRFYMTNEERYRDQITWCRGVAVKVSRRGCHTRNFLDKQPGDAIVKSLYQVKIY